MMVRVLFVATALLIAVGAMLAQLWVRGMPVRQAIKTAVFGAGFVVLRQDDARRISGPPRRSRADDD